MILEGIDGGDPMKKIISYLFFISYALIALTVLSSCFTNSDDETPSGTGISGSGFLGSCTDLQMPDSVCVDYYPGYTLSQVQVFCTSSSDIFSTNTCETDNGTGTKIPGKCKVTDNAAAVNGISYISYYTGYYSLSTAQAHCNAYLSIPGFSSEWVSD